MPRAKRSANTRSHRDDLPRLPDLTIVGGKRPVGIWVREGGQTVRPQVAIWLDPETGFIRATNVIGPADSADGGLNEALDALETAFTGPFLTPPNPPPGPGAKRRRGNQPTPPPAIQPGLPARVIVNDPALAEAARARLAPRGVPVECVDSLPAFDEAYQSLAQALGADDSAGPPEPFSWAIDPAPLPALYQAATDYARRKAWEYLPDYPPIVVTLGEHGPEPGVDTLYACVMGGGGIVEGLACYYSLDALARALQAGATLPENDELLDAAIAELRQAGVPVDDVPPEALRDLIAGFLPALAEDGADLEEAGLRTVQDSLVLLLSERDESDPTYLEWLAERKLKVDARRGVPSFVRTFPGGDTRAPNEREAVALTLAIEAVNQFAAAHKRVLSGSLLPLQALTQTARVTLERGRPPVTVAARFTPLDPIWATLAGEAEEEPLEPASPGAPTTLYRFLVTLEWEEPVWRRIELRADQTLADLHYAIQDAFEWDDDHLYAFFLSGKAWDDSTEYGVPEASERGAGAHRLEQVLPRRGKKFLYIFDFGDEWRHRIVLEAIVRDGVEAAGDYPRIVERHGEAPPQYPDWDEEDEDWEDENDEE